MSDTKFNSVTTGHVMLVSSLSCQGGLWGLYTNHKFIMHTIVIGLVHYTITSLHLKCRNVIENSFILKCEITVP